MTYYLKRFGIRLDRNDLQVQVVPSIVEQIVVFQFLILPLRKFIIMINMAKQIFRVLNHWNPGKKNFSCREPQRTLIISPSLLLGTKLIKQMNEKQTSSRLNNGAKTIIIWNISRRVLKIIQMLKRPLLLLLRQLLLMIQKKCNFYQQNTLIFMINRFFPTHQPVTLSSNKQTAKKKKGCC